MLITGSHGGPSHHLSGIVDVSGDTVTSTQRPEIGHPNAIGASNESVRITSSRAGIPHHLPRVIDAIGDTVISAQRPEIGHPYAIGAGDECVLHASSNHLSRIIDIMSNSCESIRQASQVGHARTIGAGDESVPIFLDSVPCHLASVIDASGIT